MLPLLGASSYLEGTGKREPFNRSKVVILALTGVSVCLLAVLFGSHRYDLGMMVGIAVAIATVLVAARGRLRENTHFLAFILLLVWFVTTPIASFYVRYPEERSLVTYDRLMVSALVVLLLLTYVRPVRPNVAASDSSADRSVLTTPPIIATKFELWWLALTIWALLSTVLFSTNPGAAIKLAFDSFALPIIVFHTASRLVGATLIASRSRAKWLLLAAILLAFVLVVAGTYEILTGNDAFPYKGAELIREGELRVNGPFASDSSYSVISALLFIFLAAAPRIFQLKFDFGGRVVYWLSVAACAISAMFPFFRATAVALAVSWIFLEVAARRTAAWEQRPEATNETEGEAYPGERVSSQTIGMQMKHLLPTAIGLGVGGLMLAAGAILLAPPALRDRLLSLRNAYGRLATWTVAAKIVYAHPVFGVGLGNYDDYFHQIYTGRNLEVELAFDTHAAGQPHSNLVWIAAELGVVGISLYLLANFYLVKAACLGLKKEGSRASRLSAACFLALIGVYWIPGFSLTSGAYSDLNLYYFFLLGLLHANFRSRPDSIEMTPV
ncbi:MAG TPA: O-antigen ligase family protein [Blastocatellia bacterium]|nr:O-antigen ligase family protein [Blastocatellia bacterium]